MAATKLAEGEGFELAVRSFARGDSVAIPNKQEARSSSRFVAPALSITLSGIDVRRHPKNTV